MKKAILLVLMVCFISFSSYAKCSLSVSMGHYQQGAWVSIQNLPQSDYYNRYYSINSGDSLALYCLVGPFCGWDSVKWTRNGLPIANFYSPFGYEFMFYDTGIYTLQGYYWDIGPIVVTINFHIVSPTTTGISAPSNLQSVSVAPNPFKNSCVVSISIAEPSTVSYFICDIAGKHLKDVDLKKQMGEFKISEDFSNIASGIYFLELYINSKRTVHKLVHQL